MELPRGYKGALVHKFEIGTRVFPFHLYSSHQHKPSSKSILTSTKLARFVRKAFKTQPYSLCVIFSTNDYQTNPEKMLNTLVASNTTFNSISTIFQFHGSIAIKLYKNLIIDIILLLHHGQTYNTNDIPGRLQEATWYGKGH